MPLSTQIVRDGQPLTLRWGMFHVTAMAVALRRAGLDPDADVEDTDDIDRIRQEAML